MTSKVFRSTVLASAAAAACFVGLAPSMASAQPRGQAYDDRGQYYYDGCSREKTDRAVVGGAIGAIGGALVGNSLVNKRRDNGGGALIGGLLGGFAGASIGASGAACTPERRQYVVQSAPPPPPPVVRYAPPPPPARPPVYQERYDYRDAPYGYQDDYDARYAQAPSQPPCTYIEDSVRMPNGATARRMVHVCMDSRGQYQIVD